MSDSAVDFNTLGAFYMEVAGPIIELMSAHLSPDLCYANLKEGGVGGAVPRHGEDDGDDGDDESTARRRAPSATNDGRGNNGSAGGGCGGDDDYKDEDYEDPRQPIMEAFFSLSSKLLGTINPQVRELRSEIS